MSKDRRKKRGVMIKIYLCKNCEKFVLVSKSTRRKDVNICRSCNQKMEEAKITYEEWMNLTLEERSNLAHSYCQKL